MGAFNQNKPMSFAGDNIIGSIVFTNPGNASLSTGNEMSISM